MLEVFVFLLLIDIDVNEIEYFFIQNHIQGPCMNCSQQQLWNPHNNPETQWIPKHLNGSNMSLNLPAFYSQQFDMGGGTTWINNGSYRKPDGYPCGMIPNGNINIRFLFYLNLRSFDDIFYEFIFRFP